MSDSLITKKTIAYALKKAMQNTPFQKISIGDIMSETDIRRQTFYYHFQDKYELLEWIYMQEASENIDDYLDYEHWTKVVTRLFDYLYTNQVFLVNALSTTGQNAFDQYFYQHTKHLIEVIIADMSAKDMDLIPTDSLSFFTTFYSHALVGTAKEWLLAGCPTPVSELSKEIQNVLMRAFTKK